MGAIAGLFHLVTPKPVDPARLRAMAAAMGNRGPDGAGEWTAPGVGFAHRRLALVGGADGAQPVATADLRYALVLDGTILNHRALRDELRAVGRVFVGEGDAEVVLQGFAEWGPSLLDRLEGAFAIAVHDAATQTLFLARDRLGAKPLHYITLPDGALAFASELKGLLAHPLLRLTPDARAVADYLAFGFVPDDACVIAGVQKLAAGHFLLIERGRTARPPRRWWRMEARGGELLPALRAAVAKGSAGVVPTALLSGTTADAAVVALLAEASAKAVQTVSPHAHDPVAARFATAHRVAEVVPDIDALVAAFDEPFADPAATTVLSLARMAEGPVAVSGAGAETVLSGGAGFRRFALRERLRRARWVPTLGQRLLGARETDLADALDVMPVTWWSEEGRRSLNGHQPMARYVAAIGAGEPLDGAHRALLEIALPARDLALTDRCAMAAGREGRAVLVDPALVAIALALRRSGVSVLDTAMARYLPLLPTPASPLAGWLRGPLASALAGLTRSRLLAELGWFDLDRIAHLVGAREVVPVWRMLVLERSLNRLLGWPASG